MSHVADRGTSTRRFAAIGALALVAGGVVLAVMVAVAAFPEGLIASSVALLGLAAAWYAVLRRGWSRPAGLAAAVLLIGAGVALLISSGHLLEEVLVLAALVIARMLARIAFSVHADLPSIPKPKRAVLFVNPHSGGGKADLFRLDAEARARGIEPVELQRDDDLELLVRAAIYGGADALAMAGGDGSQAIVAAAAARAGLPYACVPAGIRNHFALDLGIDRDDVVGALDALVDGGERRVDLAEVNGRVFVNNVSLGLYAVTVQRAGYREAKLQTFLDTVPDVLGPNVAPHELSWTGPDGREQTASAAVVISNNPYRLVRDIGWGTRPRIDTGVLGIAALDLRSGAAPSWREWSAPSFEIRAEEPIPAGIDGEALVLDPPLRFRILPGALRVRVARRHPGLSPSAQVPATVGRRVQALARIAMSGVAAGTPAR